MAKQTGLGDNCYVAQFDLSGDVGSLGAIGGGPNPGDVTGIDKSGYERLGLLRDGRIEFSSFFNDAAGQAHPALSSLPLTDRIVTYCRGTALGAPAASLVGKQVDYAGNRADDGMLTFAVSATANAYGIEWGRLLTAGKRTDTSATSPATGIDTTASAAFGAQAYLHVFAFTGTSATITIQDSADNSSFAAMSPSLVFTTVSGVTAERITTTATVRRYLRVITAGTFSNLVFAVNVVKNETAVTF